MNPDLESILASDEEARARIETARRDAEARIAAARRELVRLGEQRAAARMAEVEGRVRAVGEAAEKRSTERHRSRQEYLSGTRRAAQLRLPDAVEAWLRIVRDGPAGGAR